MAFGVFQKKNLVRVAAINFVHEQHVVAGGYRCNPLESTYLIESGLFVGEVGPVAHGMEFFVDRSAGNALKGDEVKGLEYRQESICRAGGRRPADPNGR